MISIFIVVPVDRHVVDEILWVGGQLLKLLQQKPVATLWCQ